MDPKQDIGFVYIHGAGLGSFIWDGVVAEMNLPYLAVEFPNRSQEETEDSNLSDYALHVITQIREWGVDKFIILAHSIGGCIGLMVAEAFKERVVGFIGLGAAIPKQGGSFVSILPFPQKLVFPFLLRVFGTRPPNNIILSSLCHGLSDPEKKLILRRFTPESRSLFTDPCPAPIPNIYKIYIELQEDKELSSGTQLRMAANLQANQLYKIPSGHLPMISHKTELCRILHKVYSDIS